MCPGAQVCPPPGWVGGPAQGRRGLRGAWSRRRGAALSRPVDPARRLVAIPQSGERSGPAAQACAATPLATPRAGSPTGAGLVQERVSGGARCPCGCCRGATCGAGGPTTHPGTAPAGSPAPPSSRYPATRVATPVCYEQVFVTSQGSPLTRLRRALAAGDLLAARAAAADLRHVELEEAAGLLVLIADSDPSKLDAAAVRFLGRACIERSFITLADAQLLAACLAQLGNADPDSCACFAVALQRLRLERAASRVRAAAPSSGRIQR